MDASIIDTSKSEYNENGDLIKEYDKEGNILHTLEYEYAEDRAITKKECVYST